MSTHVPTRPRRDERGASMIFTLLSLAMVTVLGLTLTSVGMSTMAMATAESETTEALAIADAGIEHGKQLILYQDWQTLNVFLQRGDGAACSWDELAEVPLGALPAGYPAAGSGQFIPSDGRAFGQGTYYVQLCDNHAAEVLAPTLDNDPDTDVDKFIKMRSVGFGPRGSRASLELLLGAAAMPAVVVNGNLEVKGNPEVTGPAGSIHANGAMLLSGNPCTHVYYASVNATTTTGNVQGGTGCTAAEVDSRPFSPPIRIPDLSVYQLAVQTAAEPMTAPFVTGGTMPVYTMNDAGEAYLGLPAGVDALGNAVPSTLFGPLPKGGIPAPKGWNYQAKVWKVSGDTTDGTYYVQANVEVTANTSGGSTTRTAANSPFFIHPDYFDDLPLTLKDKSVDPDEDPNNGPWVFMTILAEGNIEAHGKPRLSPAADLAFRGRIIMAAGQDVDLGATFESAYDGLFYARHQIEIQGSPVLNGQVIALSIADTASPYGDKKNIVPLKSGRMVITGSPYINYSGNGLQTVKALTWRECRGQWDGAAYAGGVMTSPGHACGAP